MHQITTRYQSRSALRNRSRFIAGFILLALPGLMFSQDQVKIVSVCEVLANLNDYGNSVVAVVGRLDVTGVIFDRHTYISQDACDQPLTTESYVWPNKILIWPNRDKQLPSPPTERPDLSQQLLVEKPSSVSWNTTLTLRKEFRIDKNGEIVNIVVQNPWVVAYGHTYYSLNLTSNPSCKEFACNGFLEKAPVIIVIDPKSARILNEDGTFADTKPDK